MKRVETAKDYSEFVIRASMLVTNIQKEANDRNLDVAKFMAVELKNTAILLEQAIDREIAKSKD